MNNYFSLRKRGLALFVALMMCLSMLPGTALAADDGCPNSYDGTHAFNDDGICKACGQHKDAGLEETQEPEQSGEPEQSPDTDVKEDPNASVEEHECAYNNNGICTICGKSKYELTEPEEPKEPEENPTEHAHCWKYAQDYKNSFIHIKTCIACGETATEKCSTKITYDHMLGLHVEECTLCSWKYPASGAHKADKAIDNGNGSHTWYCNICGETVIEFEAHDFSNGDCVCGAQKPEEKPIVPEEKPTVPDGIDVPENGTVCGTCPHCGKTLEIKNGYIVCSSCNEWTPLPYYKPEVGNDGKETGDGEIWCSQCSDYAQPVTCGGWVCYTTNTDQIKHIVVTGTNCVDINKHDHQCDYCHAEMVERKWETVKEPTCVDPGSEELMCTYEFCWERQNPVETREIAPLGLQWGEWKDNGDGTSTRVCTICNGEVEGHKETTTPESKYTLTIHYQKPGGETVYPSVELKLSADEKYRVETQGLHGYEPEWAVVEGTMPAADEVITVKYTPIEYTWTINYIDEGDNEVSAPFKMPYTVETVKGLTAPANPAVPGYRVKTESVTLPDPQKLGNVEGKVVYEPVTYTWTINYVDENGEPVADPTIKTFTVKDIDDLTAQDVPAVEGYTPDVSSVAAPTVLGNVTVNVVYRAEPAPVPTYTVTIRYEYADGTQAAPTRVLTVEDGGDYSELSPVINGYTTNQLTVSGTINGEDVEVTVIYTAVEEPEEPTPPTPTTPTTPGFPAPDTTPTAPADPGMTLLDEETPLGGTIGLDTTNHFAYIIGYEDGTVRPLDNISRAEAVTIFFRLMTDAYRTANWSTTNSFSDVNAGDWYNNAISTCLKAGALGHFAQDGSFLPNQDITRAEFASIAAGFIDDTYTGETVGDFSDTADHWAAEDIRKAVEAGWITGDGNQFRPDDPITRADVMTMINRMLDRVPDAEHMLPDMITWIDNPEGTWYYEDVQEATNEHSYERDEMGIVERWTALLEARDWKALEEEWAENGGSSLPEAERTEGE